MEKFVRVRYRVDGRCRESITPPKKMHSSIASRIKIMSGLDIAERRRPQDGKFQLKIDGRQVDFRVSTLPTIHGEKVVLRILDSGNLTLNLDSLNFEKKSLVDIREAIDKTKQARDARVDLSMVTNAANLPKDLHQFRDGDKLQKRMKFAKNEVRRYMRAGTSSCGSPEFSKQRVNGQAGRV